MIIRRTKMQYEISYSSELDLECLTDLAESGLFGEASESIEVEDAGDEGEDGEGDTLSADN